MPSALLVQLRQLHPLEVSGCVGMESLPYPRSQNNTPTEFTEFTEQTGKEYSPTDFTDLHSKFAEECDAVA